MDLFYNIFKVVVVVIDGSDYLHGDDIPQLSHFSHLLMDSPSSIKTPLLLLRAQQYNLCPVNHNYVRQSYSKYFVVFSLKQNYKFLWRSKTTPKCDLNSIHLPNISLCPCSLLVPARSRNDVAFSSTSFRQKIFWVFPQKGWLEGWGFVILLELEVVGMGRGQGKSL